MKKANKVITYYKVTIAQTSKQPFSKEDYQTFNKESKLFRSLEEAEEFIQKEYEGKKRVKIYRDNKDGEPSHCGWIYCFKNKDWSHSSKSWLQQDWVEISKITEEFLP